MKQFNSLLAILASGILSFSCAQEVIVSEEPENSGVFEYVFRVADEKSDSGKTTIDGTTVKWEANDQIGVYAEGTTNKFGKITTLNPVSFPIYLSTALAVGDKVYCYYPYNKAANDSNDADNITLTIPDTQNGDFDAMPQVSIPYKTSAALASGSTNVADIKFCNIGAIARFLVYSSTGAYDDETVESITFTANTGLAGSVSFNLTAVDYEDQSTLATSGYASLSAKTTESPIIGTSTSNAGVANLVIAPGTYYGTIVLLTDVAKYTYTIAAANKISFDRNTITKIALNLESATCSRVEKHPVGEVFVPATSITAGDKIVIASGTSGSILVLGTDRGNNRLGYNYTIDGGIIVSDENIYPLTIGTGETNPAYYTLYDSDTDGYLAASSSSSNYLKTIDAIDKNGEWEILIDATSKATSFKATGSDYTRNYLRVNPGNTPPLFSAYASGKQEDIFIFKKSTATVVSAANQDIAYTVTSVTIDYNVYNASGATTVAFKTNPGDCASNLAINEGTKKVTFDITSNAGATRTVEVNITNNGVTKTVSINQAAAPSKLVMSTITATPAQTQIAFSWDAVDGAEGYQISTNGGPYGDTQMGTSYTWTGLTAFTEYTIKVKAIGDGIYHLDSDAASKTQKTTLAVPTGITWTKATKTVTWTDTNTGAGTYGSVYKYQYTIDNGETFTDIASPGTTVVLSIDANKTFKIKAICIADSGLNSAVSEGVSCNVGDAHYYTPVTSIATGAKYILVCEYNDVKYICNPVVTSNALPLVDASSIIVAGKIESSVSNDAYAVTISGSEGAYSISYKDGEDTKYFSVTQTGSSKGKNLISADSEDSQWLITKHSDNSFRLSNDLNTQSQGRAIFIGNSGASCKFYAASNFGNSGYSNTYLTLYKYE